MVNIIIIGLVEIICLLNGYHIVESLSQIDLRVREHYIFKEVKNLLAGLEMV